jgi:hypothetical protein
MCAICSGGDAWIVTAIDSTRHLGRVLFAIRDERDIDGDAHLTRKFTNATRDDSPDGG